MNYQERLLKSIPGGAHTYSRGYDQYPANAPQILARGKGSYVFAPDGSKYLDYGMALRAVNIGYAEEQIDEAAINQIRNGNNLTRPSMIELEAAELFINTIESAEMVKFTKNGSTSVSAAVKLARAYTGRDIVARCADHPFFSYDDWFIGSTPITRGIPADTIEMTKIFRYNDIASLEELIARYPGRIACVVLEAATTEEPENDFLGKLQSLCRKNGVLLILDEMITGFRWHLKGAQQYYGLKPDLCTFGKAMANGYSVSCVAGHREIMELGSIEFPGRERVFLLSTTHGAEMSGLGAFVATVDFLQEKNVIDHLWEYGRKLIEMIKGQAQSHGISESFKVGGPVCSPYYLTLDESGGNSLGLRTLFSQEMIKNGILMPWIALSYRHGEEELRLTEAAIDRSFAVYKKALKDGFEKHLVGPVIKPVFRKHN
ncbi:MAG: glutamate-1-semialdehyde 2,1-aminomutase [Leptonema illini]|uniref:Glutamate-1-semialdehyde 2,1-aminomutase n=1 Tax=Leptonema illini TaxID=183 RepID=A0A833H385_9LEPT|nr:MAG: glutamate-1-semialdehyde 2,1-aminomutase [Leptonema illini]PKN15927.1 MAG: glutamate-1-semialdehyde 2,1-aminomutase [Deltaproteobacteria bacterium HGW-Deltaproteobacteria-23]